MRRRFPLLLKKRGPRRTGSPFWARLGDLAYHAMFIAAGLIGLWWTLSDVLIPEWRLADQSEGFTLTACEIAAKRVSERPGLAEPEFTAELLVQFTPDGGEPLEVWTRHGVSRDSPSRDEAEQTLERFEIGERVPCWYDPADPETVLLTVRRRWWPWLVLFVPSALVAIGGVGLARNLAKTQASPERRSARLASGEFDALAIDATEPRSTLATGLPPLSQEDVSPGTVRAHRLAADGTDQWRVAGMATLCITWNVLAAMFAYQIGVGYLWYGFRIVLAVLVVAPLAWIGWRLTSSAWRDARRAGGATRVEISTLPIIPGEAAEATVLQSGPMRLRALKITLVCEEIATFRQGTDMRTATAEVFRMPLIDERRVAIEAEQPLRRELTLEVPADGPHSFVSPNNEVRWSIEVLLDPIGKDSHRRRFPLCVYPASAVTMERTVGVTA